MGGVIDLDAILPFGTTRATVLEAENQRLKARVATVEAELNAAEAKATDALAEAIRCAMEYEASESARAIAEAERDAARAKLEEIGMMICCVNDFEKFDPVQLVRDQLELLRGELTSAQAGEARAVEALKDAPLAVHWMKMAEALTGGYIHPDTARFIEEYGEKRDAVLSSSAALAWLAQQRAEAAAEALEKLEAECATVFDGDLPHVTIETIREHLAALRAGATGGKS